MTRKQKQRAKRTAGSKALSELAALGSVAPLVIGSRMAGMWLDGINPTTAGRRERNRMVSEKVAAACESVATVASAAMKEAARSSLRTMNGGSVDADALLSAALRPYTRRVKANARRLSRKT